MNTHITVTNGKAFYEGVEIENFSECQPMDGIHFRNKEYPLKFEYRDGTYPLPEGWSVIYEYLMSKFIKTSNEDRWKKVDVEIYNVWVDRGHPCKVTARLIRKEQEIDRLKKELEELKK